MSVFSPNIWLQLPRGVRASKMQGAPVGFWGLEQMSARPQTPSLPTPRGPGYLERMGGHMYMPAKPQVIKKSCNCSANVTCYWGSRCDMRRNGVVEQCRIERCLGGGVRCRAHPNQFELSQVNMELKTASLPKLWIFRFD